MEVALSQILMVAPTVANPKLRTFWERQGKGIVRFYHKVGRWMPERLWLWWVVTLLIFSASLRGSQYSVRKAAKDTAIKDAQAISKHARLYPGVGENWWRNNEASHWAMLYISEQKWPQPPLWRRELLVELAYLALKERGR